MKRWPIKPLGEIAGSGQYGLNAAAMSEGTGVRFVRITDITHAGKLRHDEPAYIPENTPDLDDYELCDGDVLIARSGATAGKSYVHQLFGKRAVFAGYLIRFRPDRGKVLPRFIGAFLQTPDYWRQLNSHKRAVAQPNVNAKQLASISLPVPPLAEQERIVKLLDEADELRRLRVQANRRTADLIPALFQELFGDPLEKRWPIVRLGEVLLSTDQRDPSTEPDEEFSYVDIASVDNQKKVIISSKQILGKDAPSRARKIIYQGDVIVSTVRPNLNAVALVPAELNSQICSTGFSVLRPSPKTTSEYIFAFAVSPFFIERLSAKTKGANYPAVSDGEVKDVPLPLPPISLQMDFAQRVNKIHELETEQTTCRRRLDDLFQSMLYQAFNGDL